MGQTYYFDTKTGDYAGANFSFNIRFKDIVTIEKVYEMERQLLNAHIKVDISKINLEKSNKKYFKY